MLLPLSFPCVRAGGLLVRHAQLPGLCVVRQERPIDIEFWARPSGSAELVHRDLPASRMQPLPDHRLASIQTVMTIPRCDEEHFRAVVRENLSSARPISNPQYLRGREAKLREISRALNSPGRHVFIYGDRGIGKTYLAQTAATIYQSSDAEPILIACQHDSTLFALVRDTARRALAPLDTIRKKRVTESLRISLPGLAYGKILESDLGFFPDITTINEAVSILSAIVKEHSREPIIIIDEFDQLKDREAQKGIADLLKQISDQSVGVRIIICGIGQSLDELIGIHLSSKRYITPVGLDRLHHNARWEIITNAASQFGISVNEEFLIRIGFISDGFPYYVHLLGEMLFWAVHDEPDEISTVRSEHFHVGIRSAIQGAQVSLRLAYDSATQKYSDDYEEVLWALADKPLLRRQVTSVYNESYVPIMERRTSRQILTKARFNNRVYNLAGDRHGKILEARGAGWYQFRENVVRGYVRLRAEDQGLKLEPDHFSPH